MVTRLLAISFMLVAVAVGVSAADAGGSCRHADVPYAGSSLETGAEEMAAGDTVRWYDKVHPLSELTVSRSRGRYSRKNNPAVELMRKVIEARRRNSFERHEGYSYDKYQKVTLATNDITTQDLTSGMLSRIPDVFSQIELCPYNNKLILPVIMTETVTRKVYRRQPHAENDIVIGERADGVNTIFRSGELLVAALKDFFTDVDICDDRIRLLQHYFTSPIGRGAIGFYRFYIVDTLEVGGDSCTHLSFIPNNQQDFGFAGDIYVMTDGSFRVKRCELTIPKSSDVNFVEGMRVCQEFAALSDGEWGLVTDDMIIELSLFDFLQKAVVIRNTRIGGHSFGRQPDELFGSSIRTKAGRQAGTLGDDFWNSIRPVGLTRGERDMDGFVANMERMAGSSMLVTLLRLLVENYVETSGDAARNKVDVGPLLSIISANPVDGLRTRIGGQTTALLSPHLFMNAYYAHGWKSRQEYYKAEATYSFNRKKYLPTEFPIRSISLLSARDVCYPADKFMSNDKDNMFASLRWSRADGMIRYNRQQIRAEREEEWGLKTTLALTAEEDVPCGGLNYVTLAGSGVPVAAAEAGAMSGRDDGCMLRSIRTTEVKAELRYAPGEKFVCTRRRRRMINLEAPVLTLSHATGLSGVLGGQYRYNLTEMSFFKRFSVGSWGRVDVSIAAGAQWNRVPFPLLIMPASNLSYVVQRDMFSLMGDMEFVNDRYASAHLSWDLNGKLFNRLPLVRRLKWREYVGVKALWGSLSDKNNPMLGRNAGSTLLMTFPEGVNIMDPHRPYIEAAVGVHNILRCLHIEYVRRLTYFNLPTATKHGVRFKFSVQF